MTPTHTNLEASLPLRDTPASIQASAAIHGGGSFFPATKTKAGRTYWVVIHHPSRKIVAQAASHFHARHLCQQLKSCK